MLSAHAVQAQTRQSFSPFTDDCRRLSVVHAADLVLNRSEFRVTRLKRSEPNGPSPHHDIYVCNYSLEILRNYLSPGNYCFQIVRNYLSLRNYCFEIVRNYLPVNLGCLDIVRNYLSRNHYCFEIVHNYLSTDNYGPGQLKYNYYKYLVFVVVRGVKYCAVFTEGSE